MRLLTMILAAALMLVACSQEANGPVVLAAASLQGSLDEAADAWVAQGHSSPVISYAGSSALARQIEGGAPADIFISADAAWMDELAASGLVRSGTRSDLLGNALVVIVSSNRRRGEPSWDKAYWQGQLANAHIALADPEAVPAGRYARAALEQLGLWEVARDQVVPAENVRAALALVERGEAQFGIVYATDALASDKVSVLIEVPAASHPPIRYPAALLANSDDPDAPGFLAFLASDRTQAIFARHGFTRP